MRLEPREQRTYAILIIYPVMALLASMVFCAVLVMLSGASPFSVFGLMVKGAVGTQFAFLETLTRATPLIFTGLAAAVGKVAGNPHNSSRIERHRLFGNVRRRRKLQKQEDERRDHCVRRTRGEGPDALPPLDTVVHIAGAVDEMQNCHDY